MTDITMCKCRRALLEMNTVICNAKAIYNTVYTYDEGMFVMPDMDVNQLTQHKHKQIIKTHTYRTVTL